MSAPYLRAPSVFGDRVVFVSEDDLWEVGLSGGRAERLTAGLGTIADPLLGSDRVAYLSNEGGGSDLYLLELDAARPARRLTFDGRSSAPLAWSTEGGAILYASSRREALGRDRLWSQRLGGGAPSELGLGCAVWLALAPDGRRAIGRYRDDLARWKRYRGGLAGEVWVEDRDGSWRRLAAPGSDPRAGLARPIWAGKRLYVTSDAEGTANLWSVDAEALDGGGWARHTAHEGLYLRGARGSAETIVYTVGGALWALDVASNEPSPIEVSYRSPRVQLQPRLVDASEYAESYALDASGARLALAARGQLFSFGLWEGGARLAAPRDGARRRLVAYLPDGRLAAVSDLGGEERIEIRALKAAGSNELSVIEGSLVGRPNEIAAAPSGSALAWTNHRGELCWAEVGGRPRLLLTGPEGRLGSFSFSPDGRWIAVSEPREPVGAAIRLVEVESGRVIEVTDGSMRDTEPCFDPCGRYLYFVSHRDFAPTPLELHFSYGQLGGERVYAVTLRAEEPDPMRAIPRPLDAEADDAEDDEKEAPKEEEEGDMKREVASEAEAIAIDGDKIAERVVALGLPVGRYDQLGASAERVFALWRPLRPGAADEEVEGARGGTLRAWSLKERRSESWGTGVVGFEVSAAAKAIAIEAEQGMRALAVSAPPAEEEELEGGQGPRASRRSGWIDLDRIALEIDPRVEWRQMAREVWRLMRDHFWDPVMGGVDWGAVWARYEPLIERVSTRGEFSDLVWTMQGELGTSHAFEYGGEYREPPSPGTASLGASWRWEERAAPGGAWVLEGFGRGDAWSRAIGGPLSRPGLGIEPGDALVAIDGVQLSAALGPEAALVGRGGREVELTLFDGEGAREVAVYALEDEAELVYRDWVLSRRAEVRRRSEGRVGYMHLPDMGARGVAEFDRAMPREGSLGALIVDVRGNAGGAASTLLLDRLRRRALGWDVPRYGRPAAYPLEGPSGPLVLIQDAWTASDGELFAHAFGALGLGPRLGGRSWGGVVGIWPRHELADRSVTTQPEFAFWSKEIGFAIENSGVEPDVVIELAPDAEGDPMLERAVERALDELDRSAAAASPPRARAPRSSS